MERGQETLSEYDLPKIQQQFLTRFLQGKPLISLNVSLQYQQKTKIFFVNLVLEFWLKLYFYDF